MLLKYMHQLISTRTSEKKHFVKTADKQNDRMTKQQTDTSTDIKGS